MGALRRKSSDESWRYYMNLFFSLVIICIGVATLIIAIIILTRTNNGYGLELDVTRGAIGKPGGMDLLASLSLEELCLDRNPGGGPGGTPLPLPVPQRTRDICDCVNTFKPPPFKSQNPPQPDFMKCICDVVNDKCIGVFPSVKGVCGPDFEGLCPNLIT